MIIRLIFKENEDCLISTQCSLDNINSGICQINNEIVNELLIYFSYFYDFSTNSISNNWTIYYSEDENKNTSTQKSIS